MYYICIRVSNALVQTVCRLSADNKSCHPEKFTTDYLCKQFGPRSGLTKCQSWSMSKCLQRLSASTKVTTNKKRVNLWLSLKVLQAMFSIFSSGVLNILICFNCRCWQSGSTSTYHTSSKWIITCHQHSVIIVGQCSMACSGRDSNVKVFDWATFPSFL